MKNKSGKGLAEEILGPMTADDPMAMPEDDMMGDPMRMAASEIMVAVQKSDVGMLAEAIRAAIMSARLSEDMD